MTLGDFILGTITTIIGFSVAAIVVFGAATLIRQLYKEFWNGSKSRQ